MDNEQKLNRILMLLEDDERTGRKGYLSRQEEFEKRLQVLEVDKQVNLGKRTVYMFIGGVIMLLLTNVDQIIESLRRLFSHKLTIAVLITLLITA